MGGKTSDKIRRLISERSAHEKLNGISFCKFVGIGNYPLVVLGPMEDLLIPPVIPFATVKMIVVEMQVLCPRKVGTALNGLNFASTNAE